MIIKLVPARVRCGGLGGGPNGTAANKAMGGWRGAGQRPERQARALCVVSVISAPVVPRPSSTVPYLNANELHFAILMRLVLRLPRGLCPSLSSLAAAVIAATPSFGQRVVGCLCI